MVMVGSQSHNVGKILVKKDQSYWVGTGSFEMLCCPSPPSRTKMCIKPATIVTLRLFPSRRYRCARVTSSGKENREGKPMRRDTSRGLNRRRRRGCRQDARSHVEAEAGRADRRE